MHQQLRGIGVSPGVAFARTVLMRPDFPEVPDRTVRPDEVEGEVRRLRDGGDLGGGPPRGTGAEGAGARRGGRVAHLRRADAHGAGRGLPRVGRGAHPQQPAVRRDRLRIQGARAACALVGVAERAPARPPGRPARDPDAHAQRAPGPLGPGDLVAAARRADDRGGARALARAHGAARPRARRGPHQRGRHAHVARGDPGALARDSHRHGRHRARWPRFPRGRWC